jgi:NTP pyrophosphatase (non-canonical NTP hydrolase)
VNLFVAAGVRLMSARTAEKSSMSHIMLSESDIIIKKLASQGLQNQLDQTQEECAELIVAISKYRRKKLKDTKSDLIGEIADVSIMIRQLCELIGQKIIDQAINEKLERSKARLENGTI